jgi:hypothetical protein
MGSAYGGMHACLLFVGAGDWEECFRAVGHAGSYQGRQILQVALVAVLAAVLAALVGKLQAVQRLLLSGGSVGTMRTGSCSGRNSESTWQYASGVACSHHPYAWVRLQTTAS